MASILKLRRGSSTQNDSFTGAEGEVTFDTTNKTLRVHDGSTAGGIKIAKDSERDDNLSVANANILFADRMQVANTVSLVNTKLANTNLYIASVQSDVDANEATERSALANTNIYIAAVQSDVDANEATERSALANTNLYIASVQTDVNANEATERSALANTNSRIATTESDISTNAATELSHLANTNVSINTKSTWSGLTGTNTAIRTLVSDRVQVANNNTLLGAKATWSALASTNTSIRLAISADATALSIALG